MRRTGSEFGIRIMLSSHLMGDVESTCDRIVVLEGGQVVEDAEVPQFTQETETLDVDVDDRRDELLALLRGQGLEAGLDGISVVIENIDDDGYDKVRDAVVESGAQAPADGAAASPSDRDIQEIAVGRAV